MASKSTDHEKENILLSQKLQGREEQLSDYALTSSAQSRKLASINTIKKQQESGSKNILDLMEIKLKEEGRSKYISNQAGEITQLGLSVGSSKRNYWDWSNMSYLTKLIFDYQHSPYLIITGNDRLGVGKTDFSLLLSDEARKMGVKDKVAGNIQTDKFEYIDNWEDLKEFVDGSGKKVFIVDEARQFLDTLDTNTKEARIFSKEGDLLRKRKTHMILISKSEDQLINEFDSKITNCVFKKQSKKKAIMNFESYGNQKFLNSQFSDPIRIKNIPSTDVDFDTHEIAKFEIEEEKDESERRAIFECDQCDNSWKSRYSVEEVKEQGLTPAKCPSCHSTKYNEFDDLEIRNG